MGTILVLLAAPLLAAADLAGTYLPFLLLRGWLIGFSFYAFHLADAAGGLRRLWRFYYGALGITFAVVWGLRVEQWAVIDVVAAALTLLSVPFLRTKRSKSPNGQGPTIS